MTHHTARRCHRPDRRAASRFVLYPRGNHPPCTVDLVRVLSSAPVRVFRGIRSLPHARRLWSLHRNQPPTKTKGPPVPRALIAQLFEENLPCSIIKWKEIFEVIANRVDKL